MATLADYAEKYQTIRMERRDGILQMTFHTDGHTLRARQAQEVGLVNEVLPRQNLLPRAWALAEQLAQRPPLVLRYSRVLLTQHLKRLMHDLLGYGLALEGLGVAAES